MSIRNAITVCSVMAFSLAATAPATEPDAPEDAGQLLQFGESTPCADLHVGKKVLAPRSTSKLLAAYAEAGNEEIWVRILQRGKRYTLEVGTPKIRRRNIDPLLANRIHTRLADDVARNAFLSASNEIQMDGIWYAFSADGTACSAMAMIHLSERATKWITVFSPLFSDDANSDTNAWFWLSQLEKIPATLPTSLTGLNSERDVVGAFSSWNHPGTEPLSIPNHRAKSDKGEIEIIGELKNNMSTALVYSDVIATFYNAAGAVLLEKDALVDLSLLPAGMKSPFSMSVPGKDVAAYTLRIEAGRRAGLNPPTLRITEYHSRDDEEDLIVTGTVRNDGKADENFVEVYVNLYDNANRLLVSDSDFVVAKDPLRAGASGTFEVVIERPPGYDHCEAFIDPEYREARD